MTSQLQVKVPSHVCIIMDGNGRWAKKRLMPRNFGHRKGVETTRRMVAFFAQAEVKHLTLFAFSSENWNRPEEEVSSLMELFMQSLQKYTGELHDQGIRIRFIGNRSVFSDSLQQQIEATETKTFNNSTMILNIAANYGGHWDIVNAARVLVRQVQAGELEVANIDEQVFKRELALGDSPAPDLFIRTGGEQRISNFLLWQLAYAEFYFSDRLWPDFADADARAALDEYARRQRRYGKTGEQIEASS